MKLTDISTELGLSVSTVSRALRNAEGVDTQTRSRVLAEAARAGYRRASRQQGGRFVRTRTILVLSRNEAGTIGYDVMTGMSRAAIDMNVSLLSHQTSDEPESILIPLLQPPALRAGHVDGIILLQEWPEPLVAELRQLWPLASLLYKYEGVDTIGVCAQQGMEVLVSHLSKTGSTSIGFLGSHANTALSRHPSAAFHAACRVCGLNGWVASSGQAEAIELVEKGVTDWICADAASAQSLADRLLELGFQLPGDSQLAVFIPPSAQPGGAIRWTSLEISAEDLGIAAVRRLMRRIECPSESQRSILFRAGLSRGETTRESASGRAASRGLHAAP